MLVAKIHYMLEQMVTAKLLAHQEDTNTLHSLEMEIRSTSDWQAGRRTTARYPRALKLVVYCCTGGGCVACDATQVSFLGVLLLRCRLFQW
jgi:hypothetical protein